MRCTCKICIVRKYIWFSILQLNFKFNVFFVILFSVFHNFSMNESFKFLDWSSLPWINRSWVFYNWNLNEASWRFWHNVMKTFLFLSQVTWNLISFRAHASASMVIANSAASSTKALILSFYFQSPHHWDWVHLQIISSIVRLVYRNLLLHCSISPKSWQIILCLVCSYLMAWCFTDFSFHRAFWI